MRRRNRDAQGGGWADEPSGRVHCNRRGGGAEPAGSTRLRAAGGARSRGPPPLRPPPGIGRAPRTPRGAPPRSAPGSVGVRHGPEPSGATAAASDAPAAGDPCPGLPRLPLLWRAGRRRHLGAAAAAASGERGGELDLWPVGKVALFVRRGQAGAQPRGGGRSPGPGVHGPREPGAGAALQATGLFILQADGLRLEALSLGERRAQRRRGRGGPASAAPRVPRVGRKRGKEKSGPESGARGWWGRGELSQEM
ncbi:hypothetical protein HPG69_016559 [Diceros bicornis minor]|uniref:Uncharacterized protein n=1 Tax=Diceros bicornis minor TaxID=77932 RepID=A0A7J7EYH7_DICBM|nr:hypothetical protein HPG69_016559 [Diceros bicornis minor]